MKHLNARLQYWFVLWTVIGCSGIWIVQTALPTATHANIWQLILLSSWLLPLPLAIVAAIGLMSYRQRSVPNRLPAPLVFRIVTRGDNLEAVKKTVQNIKDTMVGMRTPPVWWIEVVTDKKLGIAEELVVPPWYTTSNGAKWKARALQYALDTSRASINDWIFHLDEESQIDLQTVYGIAEFMKENPGKIGQGAILYNRELATNPWLTLGDSLRTGDDIGRFYAQYKQGNCAFGMHGSFILVQNFIEQHIGFNFPPELCVTEDAYFGLRALENRYEFGWVDGFVYEQSPRTITDFLKQRRRWFLGIRQIVLSDLPFRIKGILALSTVSWAGSIVVAIATIVNFFFPANTPVWMHLGSDIALAMYAALYMVGLHLNLKNLDLSWFQKMRYYILLIVSIPVYSALETIAIVYAIVRPKLGFEVIAK